MMAVSAMDVAEWLRKLGLQQYEPAFRENDVDAQVLPRLTAEDLISIGVTSVGHRRRLLDAIAELAAEASPAPAPPRADAERRQLTVLFCDLVGSTPLSARLDPEDLRGIIGAYHRCVTEIVEGFGGFVARYMGDGVLVYFGYPQAHEDDAERATRCGLALVDRVSENRAARCDDRRRRACQRRDTAACAIPRRQGISTISLRRWPQDRGASRFLYWRHAVVTDTMLITRDAARYRSYFPGIVLIAPD